MEPFPPSPAPGPPPLHSAQQRVPDELLRKLHEANQRLHESREHLERQMEGSEFRHQERLDEAEGRFRLAEREVEDVTREIEPFLGAPPAEGATAHDA